MDLERACLFVNLEQAKPIAAVLLQLMLPMSIGAYMLQ